MPLPPKPEDIRWAVVVGRAGGLYDRWEADEKIAHRIFTREVIRMLAPESEIGYVRLGRVVEDDDGKSSLVVILSVDDTEDGPRIRLHTD